MLLICAAIMEEDLVYSEGGPATAEMKMQSLPHEIRKLRACLLCSLIKTEDQFELDGCDNCDDFLHMRSNSENVHDFTSSNFEGMIALTSPEVRDLSMTVMLNSVYNSDDVLCYRVNQLRIYVCSRLVVDALNILITGY